MESTTIASPVVRNMLEGARSRGYNVRQILLENGISPNILEQPRARITFPQLARLSRYLMRLMDDECYGLMERPWRRNTFKIACYAAISADTVGGALSLFSEYWNVLENGLVCSFRKDDREVRFEAFLARHPADEPPLAHRSRAGVMIYTAGTSGTPKGARRVLGEGSFENMADFVLRVRMSARERHLVVCPLFHGGAFMFYSMVATLGGGIFLQESVNEHDVLQCIQDGRAWTQVVQCVGT